MAELWHTLSPDKVMVKLGTSRAGLSQEEGRARLDEYGLNELRGKKEPLPILVFLRQFKSPLIYILLAAAVFSLVTRHPLDAGVIMGVLVANAIIGFLQETRAEKAMEALLEMAAPKANVRRGGLVSLLPAKEVVVGDIILLEMGDKVPADLRLIEVVNLKVDEAALTGEAMPVEKLTPVLAADKELAERKNMAYMGTIVSYGRATGVVVATGMATELGQIAESLEAVVPEPTPLQKSMAEFGRYVIYLFLGLLALLVVVGVLRGLKLTDMFLLAVAAAVAAIPEGLPAVVTVVLAIGMRIMAERNAVIRKLVAVETLGSATVICSDKTGTLTLNQMTVREIYVDGDTITVSGEGYNPTGEFYRDNRPINPEALSPLNELLRIGALCSDALLSRSDGRYIIFGDPTEGALVVAAAKAGLEKTNLERDFPRLGEIPFESEKQFMATLHQMGGGKRVCIKGATEKLLSMSSYILRGGQASPLTDEDIWEVLEATTAMARRALRVIATAYADFPPDKAQLTEADLSRSLVFVGLLAMADPPRKEVKKAMRLCQKAGIKVVMITGDHKLTAEAIAHELGLPLGRVVTGAELKEMSEESLSSKVEEISIFARTEPLQKLRIVNALKRHAHIVAMTGDGVNDAPALKAADIGIAMGITGTDVAKEAGDMVLADDNFASIVAAVEEGRAIFNRLRNVIFYLIGTNLSELITLMLAIFILGETPLLPAQILWVNLVTDTTGAIPLGFEPNLGNELSHPPRHPKVGFIFPGLLFRIGFIATFMGLATFLVFRWELLRLGLREARAIAFCTMVTFQWFAAFYARSDETPILRLGFFRNPYLLWFIAAAVLLQLGVVYLPFMQTAFQTVPLSLEHWGLVLAISGSLLVLEELRKTFLPHLFSQGKWQPWRHE